MEDNIEFTHTTDWYYEGNISSIIVDFLKNSGYKILKDNSHNPRLRGEDIIAQNPNGISEVIEVKGYPSEFYTMTDKKGNPKPTKPKQQAEHWFSGVLISNMYNYRKHKKLGNFQLCLGFPDLERYRELILKVEDYFTDFEIDTKIYFVDINGKVRIDNLNANHRNSR